MIPYLDVTFYHWMLLAIEQLAWDATHPGSYAEAPLVGIIDAAGTLLACTIVDYATEHASDSRRPPPDLELRILPWYRQQVNGVDMSAESFYLSANEVTAISPGLLTFTNPFPSGGAPGPAYGLILTINKVIPIRPTDDIIRDGSTSPLLRE